MSNNNLDIELCAHISNQKKNSLPLLHHFTNCALAVATRWPARRRRRRRHCRRRRRRRHCRHRRHRRQCLCRLFNTRIGRVTSACREIKMS